MSKLATRIAQLLRDTGSAHHQAYLATNGDDPDWPIWYAEFLHPRLLPLLSAEWTRSELVYYLVRVERERQATGATDWPAYYAQFFLDQRSEFSRR